MNRGARKIFIPIIHLKTGVQTLLLGADRVRRGELESCVAQARVTETGAASRLSKPKALDPPLDAAAVKALDLDAAMVERHSRGAKSLQCAPECLDIPCEFANDRDLPGALSKIMVHGQAVDVRTVDAKRQRRVHLGDGPRSTGLIPCDCLRRLCASALKRNAGAANNKSTIWEEARKIHENEMTDAMQGAQEKKIGARCDEKDGATCV